MRSIFIIANVMLALTSCRNYFVVESEPWPPETENHYLPEKYISWFDSITGKYPTAVAKGTGGISDKFYVYSDSISDCNYRIKVCKEGKKLYYSGDLYKYGFEVMLIQTETDSTILRVTGSSDSWVLEYDMINETPVRAFKDQYYDEPGIDPGIRQLDTMHIRGRLYEGLYELSNYSYEPEDIKSIKTYYLDKYFGVVRIVLSNDQTWDITPQKK